MNTSLTRSLGLWILVVLSLASAGIGGWLIAGQVSTMTATLLAGTATGVEVYVGQSLVVVGAALLGAGVVGVLLALALSAVRALLPAAAAVAAEPTDAPADDADEAPALEEAPEKPSAADAPDDALDAVQNGKVQNGSSGSIATATKISVR